MRAPVPGGVSVQAGVLYWVTSALAAARSEAEVARVLLEDGFASLGIDGGAVHLRSADGGFFEMHDSWNVGAESVVAWRSIPVRPGLPVGDIVQTLEPVWSESTEEFLERYPVARGYPFDRFESRGVVPLVVDGRCVGVVSVLARERAAFGRELRQAVVALTRQGALAFERARLARAETAAIEEAGRVRNRLDFVAAASAELVETIDYEQTLTRVAWLAVPRIADWCAVYLMHEGQLRAVEVAHRDPARLAVARSVITRFPVPTDGPLGPGRVVRTGETEFVEGVPDEGGVTGGFSAHSRITAPLVARGQVLGAISLANADGGRRFIQDDVEAVEQIAGRAALAIDNARLLREAREAVRVRDNLLSIASHELKTPITSIRLGLDVLRRMLVRNRSDPARLVEMFEPRLENAHDQVKWLCELVDELLDVTRLHAGHLDLRTERADLLTLARDSIERCESLLTEAGCVVRFEAESVWGTWDAARIEQVLVNLLTNAAKYGAGKPVHIKVTGADGRAVLQVRDAGIGLAADELGRVFGAFERTDAARNYGGLGLGLYISRQIVEAHGGAIHVQSDGPGRGSTFTVELPARAEGGAAVA